MTGRYIGRFAPSPTGPLHAGSLVAALASWLDARAHGGRWLVRLEDVDTPRCPAGAADVILSQLAACGLVADEAPCVQSHRGGLYEEALARLCASGWAYACACSRQDIVRASEGGPGPRVRHGELVYPGTCRNGLQGRPARAMRVRAAGSGAASAASAASTGSATSPVQHLHITWHDRRLGPRSQDVTQEVGDFVLKRADGLWAYQLAVVTDDALQGVTHVVRGEDLADNTPRQIHLQRLLGWPTPHYLHTPLVRGADGEKLSKQNGAKALALRDPAAALREAAAVLGLHVPPTARTAPEVLAAAVAPWRAAWGSPSPR